MKSILQLDRETQLDRQRRYWFCACFYKQYVHEMKSKVPEGPLFDSEERRLEWRVGNALSGAVCDFVNCFTEKYYVYAHDMPRSLYNGVLRWMCHAQELPAEFLEKEPLILVYGLPKNLSAEDQRALLTWVWNSRTKRAKFVLRDEDKEHTAEEMEAAQQELLQLKSIGFGL